MNYIFNVKSDLYSTKISITTVNFMMCDKEKFNTISEQ